MATTNIDADTTILPANFLADEDYIVAEGFTLTFRLDSNVVYNGNISGPGNVATTSQDEFGRTLQFANDQSYTGNTDCYVNTRARFDALIGDGDYPGNITGHTIDEQQIIIIDPVTTTPGGVQTFRGTFSFPNSTTGDARFWLYPRNADYTFNFNGNIDLANANLHSLSSYATFNFNNSNVSIGSFQYVYGMQVNFNAAPNNIISMGDGGASYPVVRDANIFIPENIDVQVTNFFVQNIPNSVKVNKTGNGSLTVTGDSNITSSISRVISINEGTISLDKDTLSLGFGSIIIDGGTLNARCHFTKTPFDSDDSSISFGTNGGVFSPGINGIGSVTIDGDLTFASNSTYRVDMNSTSSDGVTVVDGDLTIAGTLELNPVEDNYISEEFQLLGNSADFSGQFSTVIINNESNFNRPGFSYTRELSYDLVNKNVFLDLDYQFALVTLLPVNQDKNNLPIGYSIDDDRTSTGDTYFWTELDYTNDTRKHFIIDCDPSNIHNIVFEWFGEEVSIGPGRSVLLQHFDGEETTFGNPQSYKVISGSSETNKFRDCRVIYNN